jgi:hypothetical protein
MLAVIKDEIKQLRYRVKENGIGYFFRDTEYPLSICVIDDQLVDQFTKQKCSLCLIVWSDSLITMVYVDNEALDFVGSNG